jgi:hypothetical protein
MPLLLLDTRPAHGAPLLTAVLRQGLLNQAEIVHVWRLVAHWWHLVVRV